MEPSAFIFSYLIGGSLSIIAVSFKLMVPDAILAITLSTLGHFPVDALGSLGKPVINNKGVKEV